MKTLDIENDRQSFHNEQVGEDVKIFKFVNLYGCTNENIEANSSIFLQILTMGFAQTTIIAEYLWRTLDASRKRPVFLVEEIILPQAQP